MLPSKPAIAVGSSFAIARLAAFLVIRSQSSFDAQWQLAYLPLWYADWPLSNGYRFLPFPVPEAIIGPVWWFCIGVFLVTVVAAVRRSRGV